MKAQAPQLETFSLAQTEKAHEQLIEDPVQSNFKNQKMALISGRENTCLLQQNRDRENMYGAQVTHLAALWYSFAD